jgi:hypothetical protein
LATAATLFGTIPFLVWQTHRFVEPYARVNDALNRLPTDFVVIETEGTAFAIDEVRNMPDLSNRPIRLSGKALTGADIRALCARGRVAFFDVQEMHALGLGAGPEPVSARFRALEAAVPAHCPHGAVKA